MTSVEKAVEIITAQQEKQKEQSQAWCVGEQLKDLLRNDEAAAAIIVKDLEQDGNTSHVGGYRYPSSDAAFDAACSALKEFL